MNNGGYLVPANAKKGTLWFNLFREIDLIIFGVGIIFTIGLLIALPTDNIVFAVIALLPGCIAGLLVFPIPNYHNVLCALQSMHRYYTERRKYVWKGWCIYEQFREEDSNRKK